MVAIYGNAARIGGYDPIMWWFMGGSHDNTMEGERKYVN